MECDYCPERAVVRVVLSDGEARFLCEKCVADMKPWVVDKL